MHIYAVGTADLWNILPLKLKNVSKKVLILRQKHFEI